MVLLLTFGGFKFSLFASWAQRDDGVSSNAVVTALTVGMSPGRTLVGLKMDRLLIIGVSSLIAIVILGPWGWGGLGVGGVGS